MAKVLFKVRMSDSVLDARGDSVLVPVVADFMDDDFDDLDDLHDFVADLDIADVLFVDSSVAHLMPVK